MPNHIILSLFFVFSSFFVFGQAKEKTPKTIAETIQDCTAYQGFFNFYWNNEKGQILLLVDEWEEEFIYVNSLSGGVGSNDLGLDRNQLGNTRVVRFIRSGPKVLLVQPNYQYRAITNNVQEKKTVEQAFAQAVLWGFKAIATEGDKVLIDLTPFLLSDAHNVIAKLKNTKQGTFKLDGSRSFINLERCKSFPKNNEFDALITFKGEAKGGFLKSVSPNHNALTVFMHHSFIELPEPGYKMRIFDSRCGYYPFSFYDYATPIGQPLQKRFISRHRLEKKDPSLDFSQAKEPIVYYLDPGTPEPIRSALLEGASWWSEAFATAGFINAFRVKILPVDIDPMDVRYNVINWTHRSTRGWSYGSSIIDPRTGEIIKGHVLLGSLRVRQDFLIAQGLVDAYEKGEDVDPDLLEMALARLRQLAAHEVGHTIGLTHNFAASYNDRASVMDYPHPYIRINADGNIAFDQAYDVGIGEWDKRTVLYGYKEFSDELSEKLGLEAILNENKQMSFQFIADPDARPVSGAHPYAHLWDNGQSPMEEFSRLALLRRKALANFSEKNIAIGAPMSTLEDVLVPLYLMHRYQVEAVSKVIGGLDYNYAIRGENNPSNIEILPNKLQRNALKKLLETLNPAFLIVPEHILELIPPQAYGYQRGREQFRTQTGLTFDPLAVAEASVDHTLKFLLNPQRLARLIEQAARKPYYLSAVSVMNMIRKQVQAQVSAGAGDYPHAVARIVEQRFVYRLIQLAADESIQPQVAASALSTLIDIRNGIPERLANTPSNSMGRAHLRYLKAQIEQFQRDPNHFEIPKAPPLPDGSPIGCGH